MLNQSLTELLTMQSCLKLKIEKNKETDIMFF